MFKKNKSLKTKLMLSFTIISFLLIIVGGIGQLFQSKIINSYDHIVSVNLPNAVVLGDMNQDLSFMAMGLLELSVSHELRPDEKNAIKEKIKLHLDSFEKLKATYEAIPPTVQGETEVYAPIKENWSKLKSMIETGIDKLLSDNREIQNAFIKNYQTEFSPLLHDFSENLNFVLDFQKAAASENVEHASKISSDGRVYMFLAIGLGVSFGIVFGLYYSKSLSRTLSLLAEKLSEVVFKINAESSSMSINSHSLSGSVEKQAQALQETSSATEELSAMVKRNEDSAMLSSDISKQSMETAMKGKTAVNDMMDAITKIDESNKDILATIELSNQNIGEISVYIKEVANKTKVINDIVFQTKLLSFNASVEAARAQEHGKGFAVVAEEVGKLAEMSGKAAREIFEMLESSIKKVDQIIKVSRESVVLHVSESKHKIDMGIETAKNCEKVLNEVVENATKVSTMSTEIAMASQEQYIGITEISKAISLLDTSTMENTQTAKKAEISSFELTEEATKLKEIAADILVVVNG